jgi:hypothetical protein
VSYASYSMSRCLLNGFRYASFMHINVSITYSYPAWMIARSILWEQVRTILTERSTKWVLIPRAPSMLRRGRCLHHPSQHWGGARVTSTHYANRSVNIVRTWSCLTRHTQCHAACLKVFAIHRSWKSVLTNIRVSISSVSLGRLAPRADATINRLFRPTLYVDSLIQGNLVFSLESIGGELPTELPPGPH